MKHRFSPPSTPAHLCPEPLTAHRQCTSRWELAVPFPTSWNLCCSTKHNPNQLTLTIQRLPSPPCCLWPIPLPLYSAAESLPRNCVGRMGKGRSSWTSLSVGPGNAFIAYWGHRARAPRLSKAVGAAPAGPGAQVGACAKKGLPDQSHVLMCVHFWRLPFTMTQKPHEVSSL